MFWGLNVNHANFLYILMNFKKTKYYYISKQNDTITSQLKNDDFFYTLPLIILLPLKIIHRGPSFVFFIIFIHSTQLHFIITNTNKKITFLLLLYIFSTLGAARGLVKRGMWAGFGPRAVFSSCLL